MRRLLLLSVLLLTACKQAEAPLNESGSGSAAPPVSQAAYAGGGRDRLCLGGPNADAAVVSYGEGDNNCLVRGRVEGGTLIPNGDQACRIPMRQQDDRIIIGSLPPSCAYDGKCRRSALLTLLFISDALPT
jgi:hypothetical protein